MVVLDRSLLVDGNHPSRLGQWLSSVLLDRFLVDKKEVSYGKIKVLQK